MLNIDTAKVCYLINKARQFGVKEAPEGELEGSDPPDHDYRDILEDNPDDPVDEELRSFFADLNDDEWDDLLALTWIGRGDFGMDEWDDVVARARGARDERKARYLMEMPLLADYLEESLAQMGISCQELGENPPLESVP